MFEGSLVESHGLVASGTQKWTTVGSLTVQCAVAGLLIAIPLLKPQVLRMPTAAAPLAVPFLRRPPVVVKTVVAASSAAMSLPAAGPTMAAAGPSIWPHPNEFAEGDTPAMKTDVGMGSGGPGFGSSLTIGGGAQPSVAVVRVREPGAVTVSKGVSEGVSEGMLLEPIRPLYPAIARAAGVQGVVVMEAVISKAGRIESLHAVSGPPMLERSAMEAVAAARYRPYLLNGEPTEVKTTITVVFTLGG